MTDTPRKGLSEAFFTVLISAIIISSIFFPGIVRSERTEDKVEVLVHKLGTNFEWHSIRHKCSVIEEYDKFVLVETTEENKVALQREGFVIEPLENKYHVGLPSHSFDTDEGPPDIPENLKMEEYSEKEKGSYIIQFIGPIKGEWKEELRDMDVVFHEFRHSFNFIVEMDPEKRDKVEELDFVNWIGLYQPAYKFDHDLLEKTGPVNIEVSMFEERDKEGLLDEIPNFFDTEFLVGRDSITGQVESDMIELLADLPQVKSISEKTQEFHLYNEDATWIGETNVQDYRKLTEEGISGKGELITVMDSELYMEDGHLGEGVHEAWEDLEGNPVGDDHRKVQAWYVPGDSNAKLEYGVYHGTHVTGTVLGETPPYGEYSNHDGNALDARLIFQDIDNEAWGLNPPSDMYNMGWGDAYDKDSRVHTNSWGGGDGYGGLGLEADEFLWDHKDFNILFAMANSGPDPNTLSQQAEGKNVISVGSVINYPDQDDVSSFSSRGYADDGRIKPTIMHVGEGLWSAERSYDGYQSLSGTSMATPGIAGQLGQIRQYYREGWHISGEPKSEEGFEPSNALVRATLINGAVEITGEGAYHNEAIFPNNDQGYGRTNLDRVLQVQGDERKLEVFDSWDENITLDTGESWSMEFEIEDPSQELEVTLAWTDHPGSSGSDENDPAIVNDLDLELETPDGTRYVGNAFTGHNPGYSEADPISNPWSGLRDGEYDGLNVEENILLLPDKNGVEEGTYELTVSGHNIPEGEQPFAVVITGGLGYSEEEDPPSIELKRPAGGETWEAGEKEDIMWDTTPGDGTIESVDLEYSTGDSWSYIEQGIQDTGSYAWSVPENSTDEAKIRAVVHEENGLSDQDVSDQFTIEILSGPLSPTNPQPEDGSIGIDTDPELSVYVEHEEGASMDVYFYEASDDSLIAEQEEVPSGTRASTIWSGLDHGTSYEWYVEAEKGEHSNVSESWKFTTVKEHTLTINIAGEGSTYPGEGTHNYEHEEEVTITANSEEHWYFVEWTGDYEGTEEEITIEIDDEKEITAVFEEHTYTISVNKEGKGSVDIEPDKSEYKPNEEVYLTAVPREHWYFIEWTGDASGTEEEITITMDEDKEITAHFEEHTYTLDVTVEREGSVDIDPKKEEYEPGEEVGLTAIADEHCYFVEWTGAYEGTEEEITITMDEDKEITAWFEEDTYSLDVIVEGEGSVDIAPEKTEYEPEEEVDLTAIADEHWYFVEWTGDASGTEEEITITMDEDKSVTACFEENTYTLDVTVEGEGSVETEPDKKEYAPGDEVDLTALAAEHWYFVEWIGDNETIDDTEANKITMEMLGDYTIKAEFEKEAIPPEEYDLTIKIEGKGTTDPDEGIHTYEEGTQVTLTVVADKGWYFEQWTGDYEGTEEEIMITMNEDKSIKGHFEQEEHNLIISVEGEGNTDPQKGTYTHKYGEEITVEAISNKGWYFSHWIGVESEVEEDEIITITIKEDIEITARFERKEYTLKIDIIGEGSAKIDSERVTLPYTDDYKHGTEINIEAIAGENWSFDRWGGDFESYEKKISISIEGDMEIMIHQQKLDSAHFEVEILSYDAESDDGQGILLEIEYSLENTGDVEDTQEIEVHVNEEKDKSDEITLGPNEEYVGELMLEVEEEEIYEVRITCEDDLEKETIVVGDVIEDDEEDNIPSFSFLLLILSIAFSILFYYKKK